METVVKQIIAVAQKQPDKVAIKSEDGVVTYDELLNEIKRIYCYLHDEIHIAKGSSVMLSAEKNITFVSTYIALHALGATTIPVDPRSSGATLKHIKLVTTPKLLIGLGTSETDSISYESLRNLSMKYIGSGELKAESVPGDIADVMFTSGTTGIPKGVILTHGNISASTNNISRYIGNTADDVELLALPICHSFGLGRMRCILSCGGTLVFFDGFFNVKKMFKTIRQENVTGFGMVPASWAMIKRLSGERIGEFSDILHYIELGSAFLDVKDKQLLANLLPSTRICMHYGLTEASRSVFMEFHNDNLSSVGKPLPGVDVKIMDDYGNILPETGEGEICIKGPHVTRGYCNDDKLTQDSFFGDYFRTGDVGYEKDGYIFLTGRSKEIINVGGKKVSPVEIERICMEINGIQEAVCVGIDDPGGITGEAIKLYLVVKDQSRFDLDSLKKILLMRLEWYKIPHIFEYIDSIPKTENGKPKRYLLEQLQNK